MPKGNIILPRKGAAESEVNFNADFQTGFVTVSIREPLSLKPYEARVSITDFLEISAKMLVDAFAIQRAVREAQEAQQQGNVS